MQITVSVTVAADLERVWQAWISPEDIMAWNAASEDWHTPHAELYLRVGGRFLS